MFALILVFICVFLGAFGQIFIKMGMGKIGPISGWAQMVKADFAIHILTNWQVLLGLAFYVVSAVLWLAALSTLNVSFAYPLLSLAYVVVAIASYFMLKEPLTAMRWVGIVMTVLGAILITRT